jgi:hypothetical protein
MSLKFLPRNRAPIQLTIQGYPIKFLTEICNGVICYINTVPLLIHEASHSTSKAFIKSSKAKTGSEQTLSFNKLITLSCSSFYLNSTYFLSILVKDDAIVSKSFTNLLQKVQLLRLTYNLSSRNTLSTLQNDQNAYSSSCYTLGCHQSTQLI